MKVALYTIFRCTNYGAVLQAYALARVLREMLADGILDVINHQMDPRDNHLLGKITNPNTPWFQRWRNKRKFNSRYFRADLFEMRRQKTIRLIETAIDPTDRLYRNPQELRELPPCATVVVGSDQVWNPGLNHDFGRNPYLGTDFPEGQARVAYAASFGVSELPAACVAEYSAALARFHKITVREESGAAICERLLGKRPEVVLDPTLLLSADEWLDCVGERSPSRSSIAAYWVRAVTQADVDRLARLARERTSRVQLMSAGPLPKLDFPVEVEPFVDADPFDFVRCVATAESVVTDSFHGLQFATLFRKPFVVLGQISDPRSNASRLVDFCARYGLSGGVWELEAFRAGQEVSFAEIVPSGFSCLESDRVRSKGILKGLLP